MIASATRIPVNGASIAATHQSSYRSATPTNSAPVASSVSGYTAEIFAEQLWHRPRNASQETTGMLSTARSGVPHEGHRDRGWSTDCPSGTRWIRTVRKLPNTSPRGRNTAIRNAISTPVMVAGPYRTGPSRRLGRPAS
jgi:hypothetical protein